MTGQSQEDIILEKLGDLLLDACHAEQLPCAVVNDHQSRQT